MNACEVFTWCNGQFHDSTDEAGRPLHSKVWSVLSGGGEVAVLIVCDGSPAYVDISLQADESCSSDAARRYADTEPAQYAKTLREAADMVDQLNQTLHSELEVPDSSTGQGEDG